MGTLSDEVLLRLGDALDDALVGAPVDALVDVLVGALDGPLGDLSAEAPPLPPLEHPIAVIAVIADTAITAEPIAIRLPRTVFAPTIPAPVPS